MNDNGAFAALESLLASDPAVADREQLGAIIRSSATLRAFVDIVDVRCNRRARELNEAGESESAASVLLDEGRRSGKEVAATDARDRVCEEMPELEDALETGDCSSAHLDVVARLTKGLSDAERADLELVLDDLIESAASDYVSEFERKLKEIIARIKKIHAPNDEAEEFERQRDESSMKRWTDKLTGMKMTLLSMDPLRDAAFHHAVEAQLASLKQDEANAKVPYGSLQIDAVLLATERSGAGGRRIPEVVVHVDHGSVHHGRHEHTLCETIDGAPVPVGTLQRLCCEAIVSAVVVDADGTNRKLTAEQRTATREQRRALAAMYATCAHPHCSVGFSRCRIHHVIWWTRGGKTILENLLPLCDRHHHLVHEGGWNLELSPDRMLTWIRPDGTTWKTHRSPNRRIGVDPPDAEPVVDPEVRQPSLC